VHDLVERCVAEAREVHSSKMQGYMVEVEVEEEERVPVMAGGGSEANDGTVASARLV